MWDMPTLHPKRRRHKAQLKGATPSLFFSGCLLWIIKSSKSQRLPASGSKRGKEVSVLCCCVLCFSAVVCINLALSLGAVFSNMCALHRWKGEIWPYSLSRKYRTRLESNWHWFGSGCEVPWCHWGQAWLPPLCRDTLWHPGGRRNAGWVSITNQLLTCVHTITDICKCIE